jgi:hypothetical protein
MEALTDRVERLETDEPCMRPISWPTKKKAKEPVVERQTPDVKLIWDLKVNGIPVFNGESQSEMIKTFIRAFEEAIEVMNMGGNEILMHAIFMSKLGIVARTWKQSVEREQPGEVPETTKEWLQRLRRDFYPEEMLTGKWAELTVIRQDHHSLQCLVETFTALRIQTRRHGNKFLCGNRHKREESCTGPVINLKDHIKEDKDNAKQKGTSD